LQSIDPSGGKQPMVSGRRIGTGIVKGNAPMTVQIVRHVKGCGGRREGLRASVQLFTEITRHPFDLFEAPDGSADVSGQTQDTGYCAF